jgi:hypothetical protein
MADLKAEIAAALKQERVRIARAGGQARAKKLSEKRRRAIAIKASRAAAKKRANRAK